MITTGVPAPLPTIKPPPQNCKGSYVDLLFVVDSSASIKKAGAGNWQKVISFIQQTVRSLEIGTDKNQIAIVNFATKATLVRSFAATQTIDAVETDISNINYDNGNTDTAAGLQMAHDQVFGKSGDRNTAADVVILITDGKPNKHINDAIPAAEKLHDRDIKVITIGVTDGINEMFLKGFSSPPQLEGETYFKSPDFDQVMDIITPMLAKICSPPKPPYPPVVCTKSKLDLTFIVDTSASIKRGDPENWTKLLDFLKKIVNAYEISDDANKIAIVSYSTKTTVVRDLSATQTREAILNDIANIPYDNANTNTAAGLRRTRQDVYAKAGDRPDGDNVVILFTDGKANRESSRTFSEAIALRSIPTKVIVVGITNAVRESEIRGISSHPQKRGHNYFMSADFDSLNKILSTLVTETCVTIAPQPTKETAPPVTTVEPAEGLF